jgi:hypothetical protein
MGPISRRTKSFWLCFAILALISSIVISMPTIAHVVLAFAFVTVSTLVTIRGATIPMLAAVGNRTSTPQPSQRVADLRSRALTLPLTKTQLGLFNYLLLYPTSSRVRVSERVDLRTDQIERTGATTIHLPYDLPATTHDLLVPILRPVKGRSLAGLRVCNNDGTEISTWTRDESLVIVYKLLDLLVHRAFGVAPADALSDAQNQLVILGANHMLENHSSSKIDHAPKRYSERAKIGANIRAYAAKQHLIPSSHPRFEEFVRLVQLVSCNYIVVASHAYMSRLVVTYKYEVPTRTHAQAPAGVQSNRRFVRAMAELRSLVRRTSHTEAGRVRTSVNRGNSCGSYHLDIVVPRGAHAGAIRLLDQDGRIIRPSIPTQYDVGAGSFHISGRGTDTAHLYARRLVECVNIRPAAEDNPSGIYPPAYLEIATVESPPGAMGRALAVSVLVTVLTYVAAVRAQEIAELNIDTLALIGGVLGAALLVYGFIRGSEDGTGRVISILALGSGVASMALLLTSAILLSSSFATGSDTWTAAHGKVTFAGVTSWPWVVCCSLSLATLLWTFIALVIRMLRYQRLTDVESTDVRDPDAVVS